MKIFKIPLHPPLMKGGNGFFYYNTALIMILSFIAAASKAEGQTAWQKYVNNPVMTKDTTIAGIWEWAGIGQPACIFENDTIKMYYAAAGVAYIGDSILRGRISYAHSQNGIAWIKRNPPIPVLDVGGPGSWDSRWLDTPAIAHGPDGYRLYYYGDSQSVAYSAIGVASSPDGINWTKDPSNPVLEKGELTGFDGFWIESPAVLYDSVSNLYEMWYTGVGYGPGLPSGLGISIGRATSEDGVSWIKDSLHNPVLDISPPGSWDDGWVAVPAVRKTGGLYRMWYIGSSIADYAADSTLDTARVGYAISWDGITWFKYGGNPVLSTFDPPVDTGGPWAPDVIFDGSAYQMLYEAADGINLATAYAGIDVLSEHEQRCPLTVFPNPFSISTTIRLSVAPTDDCEISFYNCAGQKVKSFTVRGVNSCKWTGNDDAGKRLPSGVYYIRLRIGGQNLTMPCVKLE
jgi:predicted GH43/DUF377 family glycosyl hydrolase